jgi:hypothetical protein
VNEKRSSNDDYRLPVDYPPRWPHRRSVRHGPDQAGTLPSIKMHSCLAAFPTLSLSFVPLPPSCLPTPAPPCLRPRRPPLPPLPAPSPHRADRMRPVQTNVAARRLTLIRAMFRRHYLVDRLTRASTLIIMLMKRPALQQVTAGFVARRP